MFRSVALTVAVVFAATSTSLGELRPLALGLGVPAAVAALTLAFGPLVARVSIP